MFHIFSLIFLLLLFILFICFVLFIHYRNCLTPIFLLSDISTFCIFCLLCDILFKLLNNIIVIINYYYYFNFVAIINVICYIFLLAYWILDIGALFKKKYIFRLKNKQIYEYYFLLLIRNNHLTNATF